MLTPICALAGIMAAGLMTPVVNALYTQNEIDVFAIAAGL
jgi:hypothetical protein